MVTLATPETLSRRGTIVHRDSKDMSIERLVLARQPDHHQSSGRRQRLHDQGRLGRGLRQGRCHRQPLLNHLTGPDRVGARLEGHLHRAEPRDRPRLELASHGIPLKNSFSIGFVMRFSTSSADRPSASTCTSTPDRSELGKGLDRRVPQLHEPDDHQGDAHSEHQALVPLARSHDPSHRDDPFAEWGADMVAHGQRTRWHEGLTVRSHETQRLLTDACQPLAPGWAGLTG